MGELVKIVRKTQIKICTKNDQKSPCHPTAVVL